MDFWNLFENPTFMFVFHEIVCILGALYYLPYIFTRIREKKEGKKFTVCWKDLKNIVATYVVVAESLLLYEDIKTHKKININLCCKHIIRQNQLYQHVTHD